MHHQFDDSPDDYDMDMDQRTRSIGNSGRSGRTILLGNGTEVLTNPDDSDTFEHGDEDKDLQSQIDKGQIQNERETTPAGDKRTPSPHSTSSPHSTPKTDLLDAVENSGEAEPKPSKSEDFKIQAATDSEISSK